MKYIFVISAILGVSSASFADSFYTQGYRETEAVTGDEVRSQCVEGEEIVDDLESHDEAYSIFGTQKYYTSARLNDDGEYEFMNGGVVDGLESRPWAECVMAKGPVNQGGARDHFYTRQNCKNTYPVLCRKVEDNSGTGCSTGTLATDPSGNSVSYLAVSTDGVTYFAAKELCAAGGGSLPSMLNSDMKNAVIQQTQDALGDDSSIWTSLYWGYESNIGGGGAAPCFNIACNYGITLDWVDNEGNREDFSQAGSIFDDVYLETALPAYASNLETGSGGQLRSGNPITGEYKLICQYQC